MEKEIIDVTGTPLTPSKQGRDCLGNGKHPKYECCCDECDYFLRCYPQYISRELRESLKKYCADSYAKDGVKLYFETMDPNEIKLPWASLLTAFLQMRTEWVLRKKKMKKAAMFYIF